MNDLSERVEQLEDVTAHTESRLAKALERIDQLEALGVELHYEAERAKVVIASQRWFIEQASNHAHDGLRVGPYVDRAVERFDASFVDLMKRSAAAGSAKHRRWLEAYRS